MSKLLFTLCVLPILGQDAAGIMAKVAANVEQASDARKQYVYHQRVHSSLVRASGDVARREKREYSAFPGENRTEKKLVSFSGEYRKGKQMIAYSDPGHKYKGMDLDGDLISSLTEDLVNDTKSRDGIPHSLFPLSVKDLPSYNFVMMSEAEFKGRRTYIIKFEPQKKETCLTVGSEDNNECQSQPWKGEVWVDAAEFQPIRIDTHLAFEIPWGVRVFLGTNLRQTGFSVTYVRVAENVWFPATYGTEFRLNVLWGYKRTITLSMESSAFQKTDATSTINYDVQ